MKCALPVCERFAARLFNHPLRYSKIDKDEVAQNRAISHIARFDILVDETEGVQHSYAIQHAKLKLVYSGDTVRQGLAFLH